MGLLYKLFKGYIRDRRYVQRFNTHRWKELQNFHEEALKDFVKPVSWVMEDMSNKERKKLIKYIEEMDNWRNKINKNIKRANQNHLSQYATAIERVMKQSMKLYGKYVFFEESQNRHEEVLKDFVKPLSLFMKDMSNKERKKFIKYIEEMDNWRNKINKNIKRADQDHLLRYATAIERVEEQSMKLYEKYVFSTEKPIETWTSYDSNQMLKAVSTHTNPINRHFFLQTIVERTYKNRNDPKMRKICKEIGEKHIWEFKKIETPLRKHWASIPNVNGMPRVTTFQHLATLLTEDGDYDRAIEICKIALNYGLHDGTKTGFKGRIRRIEKKKNTQ